MIRKVDEFIVYKDPQYYLAFPSCVTLDGGGVLVSCRRALEPRFLLDDDAPPELANAWSHLESRSHNALIELDASLAPVGQPRTMPMNPEAADQDGSMTPLASGRIMLSGFSWYPFPPGFAGQGCAPGRLCRNRPDREGLCWVFWGGFTRTSDDGGRTWSDHNYLPPMPDMPDIVPHKRPYHGGATRGRMAESHGELLLGVYTPLPGSDANTCHCYASADDGQTWAYRAPIAVDESAEVGLGEPAMHRCESGKIICFIRSAELDDRLVTAESVDNGRTWSPWKPRDVVGHPYTPCGLPDGRMLLICGYRHEPFGIRCRVLDGECSDLDTAEEFIIRDDGLGFDLGYPWATVLPDGKVLAVYYIYGEDGPRHIAGSVLEVS